MKILSEQIAIRFRNKDLNIDPTLNIPFRIFLPKKEEQVSSIHHYLLDLIRRSSTPHIRLSENSFNHI